jgi:type IV secretory pathway VirB4 component
MNILKNNKKIKENKKESLAFKKPTIKTKIHHSHSDFFIEISNDFIQTNSNFYQILKFKTFTSKKINAGFLQTLQKAGFDLSIYFATNPITKSESINLIKENHSMFYSELEMNKDLNKQIDPALERNYKESEEVLNAVETGDLGLYRTEILIRVKGKNKIELTQNCSKVIGLCESHNLKFSIDNLNQKSGFLKSLGVDFTNPSLTIPMTTDTMVGLLPLIHRNQNDFSAIIGRNSLTNETFGLNFAPEALRNFIIAGTSGFGKTHLSIIKLAFMLLNGIRCIVIDPKKSPEYKPIIEHFHGNHYDVSPESLWSINLMQKIYLPLLVKLIQTKLDRNDISEGEISTHLINMFTNSKDPTFKEFAQSISNKVKDVEEKLFDFVHPEGRFYKKFDTPTNINISHLTCIYVGNLPDDQKTIIMEILTGYIEKFVYDKKIPTQLIIDEAHRLCGSGLISNLLREVRFKNGGVTFISQFYQDIYNDLVNSNTNMESAGIANFAGLFFFKQGVGSDKELFHDAGVNQSYISQLSTLARGNCLALTQDGSFMIKTFAIPNLFIKEESPEMGIVYKRNEEIIPHHVTRRK